MIFCTQDQVEFDIPIGSVVGVKSAPSSGAAHPGLAAFKKARSPAHPPLTLDHPSAHPSAHPPLTTASGDQEVAFVAPDHANQIVRVSM